MWTGSLTSSASRLRCCDLLFIQESHGSTRPVPRLLLLAAEQLLRCQTQPLAATHSSKTRHKPPQKKILVTFCSVVCLIWIILSRVSRSSYHQFSRNLRHCGSYRSPGTVPLVRPNGLKRSHCTCQALISKRAGQVSCKESQPLTCFYTDNLSMFPPRPEQLVFFFGPVTVTLLAAGEELQCQGPRHKAVAVNPVKWSRVSLFAVRALGVRSRGFFVC